MSSKERTLRLDINFCIAKKLCLFQHLQLLFFSFTLQTVPSPFSIGCSLSSTWPSQKNNKLNPYIGSNANIYASFFVYLKLKKYKSQWVELHWVFLVLVKHTVYGSLYWPLFIISSINLKVYKTPHFQVVPTFCKTGEERNNAYCSTKYCT